MPEYQGIHVSIRTSIYPGFLEYRCSEETIVPVFLYDPKADTPVMASYVPREGCRYWIYYRVANPIAGIIGRSDLALHFTMKKNGQWLTSWVVDQTTPSEGIITHRHNTNTPRQYRKTTTAHDSSKPTDVAFSQDFEREEDEASHDSIEASPVTRYHRAMVRHHKGMVLVARNPLTSFFDREESEESEGDSRSENGDGSVIMPLDSRSFPPHSDQDYYRYPPARETNRFSPLTHIKNHPTVLVWEDESGTIDVEVTASSTPRGAGPTFEVGPSSTEHQAPPSVFSSDSEFLEETPAQDWSDADIVSFRFYYHPFITLFELGVIPPREYHPIRCVLSDPSVLPIKWPFGDCASVHSPSPSVYSSDGEGYYCEYCERTYHGIRANYDPLSDRVPVKDCVPTFHAPKESRVKKLARYFRTSLLNLNFTNRKGRSGDMKSAQAHHKRKNVASVGMPIQEAPPAGGDEHISQYGPHTSVPASAAAPAGQTVATKNMNSVAQASATHGSAARGSDHPTSAAGANWYNFSPQVGPPPFDNDTALASEAQEYLEAQEREEALRQSGQNPTEGRERADSGTYSPQHISSQQAQGTQHPDQSGFPEPLDSTLLEYPRREAKPHERFLQAINPKRILRQRRQKAARREAARNDSADEDARVPPPAQVEAALAQLPTDASGMATRGRGPARMPNVQRNLVEEDAGVSQAEDAGGSRGRTIRVEEPGDVQRIQPGLGDQVTNWIRHVYRRDER